LAEASGAVAFSRRAAVTSSIEPSRKSVSVVIAIHPAKTITAMAYAEILAPPRCQRHIASEAATNAPAA